MAGQLDSLFKNVAKTVVAQFGDSFDHSITYTKKSSPSYNTSTGALTTTDVTYNIKVPISFVRSEEEAAQEMREAKLYITCLLYTSPSPRDRQKARMPSSA